MNDMTTETIDSTDPVNSAPADPTWHLAIDSPVGRLFVVAHAEAIVGLYHEPHQPTPGAARLGCCLDPVAPVPNGAPTGGRVSMQSDPSGPVPSVSALLREAHRQIDDYFTGRRRVFELPLVLHGTAFQQQVWAALGRVPYGERRTYGELAGQLGNASMGRAIGAAIRANPVSIIVPGHRVVGRGGAVTGYAAGTGVKAALLELESGAVGPPPAGVVEGQRG